MHHKNYLRVIPVTEFKYLADKIRGLEGEMFEQLLLITRLNNHLNQLEMITQDLEKKVMKCTK